MIASKKLFKTIRNLQKKVYIHASNFKNKNGSLAAAVHFLPDVYQYIVTFLVYIFSPIFILMK